MTHDQIIAKLLEIRPGARWNLRGNTYETFEWLDAPETKPTHEEIFGSPQ